MRIRMEFQAVSLLVLLFSLIFSVRAEAQEALVTIVDSSENMAPHVKDLSALGVTVIGRYYGRCPQGNVPNKRMIDNLDEIRAILNNGVGLLSVYQFHSQENKFDSNRSSRKVSNLDERPRNPDAKTVEDFNDCITPDRPNTIEEDARLDAYAAVTQAKQIVKQPAGTAIYFGVDFDLNQEREENVLSYFRIVRKIVTDAGYVLGVYGNGAISDLLYGENSSNERLVEYVWLTASSSHAGSARTYNVKHWDLLQTKVDTKWSVSEKMISIDTDIQNPESTDVGFWTSSASFIVPHDRNVAIHHARRFVCDGRPVVVNPVDEPAKRACTATFGIAVRIFEIDASKKLARVDCNEDGDADGWMKLKDLSTRRPLWVDPRSARQMTHCSSR
ncbi:glycoside hydrolase domain-containing protein [Mesorhizobium sp. M0199]|uniref:glycoside hydrolase domain-containing protein n=1 Tax=Mesorhizobium sp. M0199 TaxID=2956911 RepID=UPI0033357C49